MKKDIYERMIIKDPKFREFVEKQKNKTVKQIAEEYGIILSHNCPENVTILGNIRLFDKI